ncbi:MAG: hypothetical protein F6J93_38895 [Oscillatoria sp. SIO1A7]|nr:hypothetical protein [Oscillatoria sp. SIO1A7]
MTPKIETIDDFFDLFFPDFQGGTAQKDAIIATLLSKSNSTVSAWRTKGVPSSELAHLESLALHLSHCQNILRQFSSKGFDLELLFGFVKGAIGES